MSSIVTIPQLRHRVAALSKHVLTVRHAGFILVFAVALAMLAMDRLPRFYQGDSISYLATGINGWIPPDRSWAYGYVGRWLLVLSGHAVTLVILQTAMLLGSIVMIWRLGQASGVHPSVLIVFGLLAVADPLLEIYTRLWLSDVPAMTFFVGFLWALSPLVIGAGRVGYGGTLLYLFLWSSACIFVRVAYAPVELFTILSCIFVRLWRPSKSAAWRLLPALAIPPLSLLLLATANSFLFAGKFSDPFFINRMSSLYSLGVFLPAIRLNDFIAAGVHITPAQFARFHSQLLNLREANVWLDGDQFVRYFLQTRGHFKDVYDTRFQQLCARIVHHALWHQPLAFVQTYLGSLRVYLTPHVWAAQVANEIGTNRNLPDWVVNYLNFETKSHISATYTQLPSVLLTVISWSLGGYPWLLMVGLALSLWNIFRPGPADARMLASIAIIATLLSAPFYSHWVKPRYVLTAVLFTYFLICCQCAAVFGRWQTRRR